MNLQPRQPGEDPQLNITPLIDVVFLLLIFFMVTTTFQREAQLKVQIPEASAVPEQVETDTLEVIVDSQGRYFIGQNEVVNTRPETLRAAINKAAGDDTDRPVVIRADARAPHQAVVTAMDVLGQLGFSRLSIATTQPGESS